MTDDSYHKVRLSPKHSNSLCLTVIQMDSQVTIEGYFVDLVDDAWRLDTLPEDDISVPVWELADPEADSSDIHLTLKEQEQKWSDIMLTSLSEHQ